MTMNDPLAAALSGILNLERIGRNNAVINCASSMITKVLTILNEKGYVGSFEKVDDGKAGIIKVNLLGKINKCGVVKPRHAVSKDNFERYEKRYLPAKNFGLLVVSTSKGLMTQDEARKNGIGGKLIAYCY
ncbi:30S ribosomal protein S8 [Candidatus Woesearchaeota archaeon]|nr:30S ribosomal protein S8 [Candidatus Woesearchaeota archaeon]